MCMNVCIMDGVSPDLVQGVGVVAKSNYGRGKEVQGARQRKSEMYDGVSGGRPKSSGFEFRSLKCLMACFIRILPYRNFGWCFLTSKQWREWGFELGSPYPSLAPAPPCLWMVL